MEKFNKLFTIWGIIVVIIMALLTFLGFELTHRDNYKEVEDKLVSQTKKYVEYKFLYPEDGKELKITSTELMENDYLDNLEYESDTCIGYVIVKKDDVYKYIPYIKCDNYTSKGYN